MHAAWTAPPVMWVWREALEDAGGADLRVRGQHQHVLDAQLRPRDLRHHRHEALTDLSRPQCEPRLEVHRLTSVSRTRAVE